MTKQEPKKPSTSTTKASVTTPGARWPEKKRGSPEWLGKLRKYGKEPGGHRKDLQIKAWSKAAIAWQIVFGKTNKETAEHFDVAVERYERHKRSDQGKEWQAKIEALVDDPNEIVRLVLQSEGLQLAIDQFALYETAKAKGDVRTAHNIAKNLLDYADLAPKKGQIEIGSGPIQLTINVTGSPDKFLESPPMEAEYEIISDEPEKITGSD